MSIGFISFVSSTNAIQATGLLTLAPVGLTPTEQTSLRWTHSPRKTPSTLYSNDLRNLEVELKAAAGLDWVGFHDLRRFRASQWVRQVVDVRTVKELLGHRDIQTTMRYAMFVTHHGMQSIRSAEQAELEEPKRVKNG